MNFSKRNNSKLTFGDDQIVRTSTKGLSTAFGIFSTATQRKKLMTTLQNIAKEQRSLREQAEKRLEDYKKRNINREKQFYNILSRFNVKNDPQIKSQQYIQGLYQKILGSFNAFNQRAHEILQDRYGEMYRLMERRIDIIMQKMEIQLKKNRNLSEMEIKNIRQQIKSMADVALNIETENIAIRKKNESLQLKNKLLTEQKKLLLQQMNQKKQLIIKLAKKNKNTIYASPRLNKNRQTSLSLKQSQISQRKSSISNSVNLDNNNPSIKLDQFIAFQNNFQSIQFQNQKHQTISGRISKSSRSYRRQNLSNTKTVDKKRQYDLNPQKSSNQFKKTVLYLQQSLQRQKIKRNNLTRFSLQIQKREKSISEFIEKQLKRISKSQNLEQNLQKILKQLKKMLSIPENNQIGQIQYSYDIKKQDQNGTLQIQMMDLATSLLVQTPGVLIKYKG